MMNGPANITIVPTSPSWKSQSLGYSTKKPYSELVYVRLSVVGGGAGGAGGAGDGGGVGAAGGAAGGGAPTHPVNNMAPTTATVNMAIAILFISNTSF